MINLSDVLELLEALVRHDYGICFGGGILIGKKWRRRYVQIPEAPVKKDACGTVIHVHK